VDLLQGRGRVDAELLGQPPADVLVRRQRVGLPPRRVERANLLAADALAQRMVPGQGLELGQHLGVAAELERRVDAVLGRGEAPLGQPIGGGVRPRLAGGVGQRRAAPERERVGEQPACPGRIAVQLAATGLGQALELGRVDQARVDGQPVSGRHRLDRAARQRPPQPGDQRLQRVDLVGRRCVAPEVGDQGLHADRASRFEGEPGEQRTQPGPADLDRPAVVVGHQDGPEDRYPHGSTLTGRGDGFAGRAQCCLNRPVR
jgi:hypothetical protein